MAKEPTHVRLEMPNSLHGTLTRPTLTAMTGELESVEHYRTLFDDAEAFYGDGATVLVARGATVEEVVRALGGVPPDDVPEHEWEGDELMWSTYAVAAIDGGVIATEDTGYADPANSALVTLSQGGRAAAVVRDNIQAHIRFAAARDGQLVFDDDEYRFLEDRTRVPAELRTLFDLAWFDLDDDDQEPVEDDSTAVGLAMAEVITGLHITPEDAAKLADDDVTVVAVRPFAYVEELTQN